MLQQDYVKYVLTTDLVMDALLIRTMFSLPFNNADTKYYKIKDNKYYVTIDDKLEVISDIDTTRPIFKLSDVIKIDSSWVLNLKDNTITESKLGMLLINMVLLVRNFKDKIEYINKDISISKIESIIANILVDDKDVTNDKISVSEYIKFVDSCKYIESWTDVLVVSATEKSILPPPNIVKIKKDIIKKYINKYGDDVLNDLYFMGLITKELQDIDNEYMKDDPSYGIVTTKKVLQDSRSKMFLTIASDAGFNGNGKFVSNSLTEGWPTDPEELASIFNSSRAGSYSRGVETKDGGLLAKILLRATNTILIQDNDCKTKISKKILVSKNNIKYLAGRTKPMSTIRWTEDELTKLIGKVIEIRSPQYCKEKGGNYCKYCVSEGLSTRKDGISILVTDLGSTILYISMKKMHASNIAINSVNIKDICS